MDQTIKKKIDNCLHRIINILILNSSFTNNLGLINGRLGVAIFFYHYYRYTNNVIYEDFANQLISEIYEDINKESPIDFFNGLTGIGWGIEYLVKNKFVEADTDEVLEDIDATILSYRLKTQVLLNKNDLIFGFGLYQLARLQGENATSDELSTLLKKESIIFLIDECERIVIEKEYIHNDVVELSIDIVNSILFFLLKAFNYGLMTTKTTKIIQSLVLQHLVRREANNYSIETNLLMNLLTEVLSIINDENCISTINDYLIFQRTHEVSDNTKTNKEMQASRFIKKGVYSFLYPEYNKSTNDNNSENDIINFMLNNESWWEKQLINLNKDSLGLNGLSGIGMGLLKFIENQK